MPFIPPTYVSEPYAFTGLTQSSLPPTSQEFLDILNTLLTFHSLPPASFIPLRQALARDLSRNLLTVDTPLILLHHEARPSSTPINDSSAGQTPPEQSQELNENNEKRLNEVISLLLPVRESIMTNFVLKFDTLVWLEGQLFSQADFLHPAAATDREIEAYRSTLLIPYIRYTEEILPALDEALRQSATSSLPEHRRTGAVENMDGDISRWIEPVVERMLQRILSISDMEMRTSGYDVYTDSSW